MVSTTPRIDRLDGYQNLAINGAMDFFQRGTSITNRAAGDTNFLADRFKLTLVGTSAIYRMDRSTDVPTALQAGYTFPYSLAIQVTTADAAVAAGDLVILRNSLEGFDYLNIANGKTVTIATWVKSVLAGTYCLEFRNDANDRYYIREYTLAANTWTQVIVSFATDTGGTWRTDNGVGLGLCWTLMCGSTFQSATTNAWAAGNFRGTANQANFSSSTSNIFYTTGLQIIEGSFDSTNIPPFRRAGKNIQQELALCQRYTPAYYFNSVSGPFGQFRTTTDGSVQVPFMTSARSAPTSISLVGGGTYQATVSNGTTTSISNPTFNSANIQGCKVDFTGGTGGTAGGACQLVNTTAGAAIIFEGAEI